MRNQGNNGWPCLPPTNPEDIKIFAAQKPNCILEELGLIVTNVKWNQERAVTDAKEKAAEIGEHFIQLTDVKRNSFNDAAVQAVAFRCK